MIAEFTGRNRFLSNFFESEVEFEGAVYRTVEHAFQAAKTLDLEERKKIADAPTPGTAKYLGRRVRLRKDWEDIKISVMTQIVRAKFHGDARLRNKLLDTGDSELVEGNNWGDRFWGVCDGSGENHLGKILMQVRQELREKRDKIWSVLTS